MEWRVDECVFNIRDSNGADAFLLVYGLVENGREIQSEKDFSVREIGKIAPIS